MVSGRALAHLTVTLPGMALYLIVLPRVYGLPALGKPSELLLLAAPFALATSLLGQAVGARLKSTEAPVLLFIALSTPLLFLVGFAWPREAIPDPVLAAGSIFPSEFAIDGLLRVNQTGAGVHDVVRDWRGLWLLTAVYFALAVFSARLERRSGHG